MTSTDEARATVTAAVADVSEAMQSVSESEFQDPYYDLYRLRAAQDALGRAVDAMAAIAAGES